MTEFRRLPYGRQSLDEDDIAAVVAALRSDWLTTGPLVQQFEEALAQAGAVSAAVSVSSGTAALHCGYAALGITAGTSIVTSPLTFVATASAAMHLGARVIFADVTADSGNLDPSAAADAVASDTRAIVPTDFAGQPADYAALSALTRSRDVALLADAAHSFGARFEGQPVAALTDAATVSFHPVKSITTAEGGALLTSNETLAQRARAFRNHGIERDPSRLKNAGRGRHHYEVQSLGLNYRLPDVLCALGLSQMRRLESFTARRDAIAQRYSEALSDVESLELPATDARSQSAWHLYVLRVRDAARREALFEALSAGGLGVQVHYPPVHLHPLFADLGYQPGSCPAAEDFSARALSIPLYPAMQDDDVGYVIDRVRAAAKAVL